MSVLYEMKLPGCRKGQKRFYPRKTNVLIQYYKTDNWIHHEIAGLRSYWKHNYNFGNFKKKI